MLANIMSAELERRIRRLEALESIRSCIYSYAAAGDRRNDPVLVRKLFADDATYEIPGMLDLAGLEGIVAGLSEIARTKVLWAFHHPGGPLIELGADATTARAFWWVWIPVQFATDEGPVPHWTAGHYNAELVAAGESWKFRRLLFEAKLLTPIDAAWSPLQGEFQWLV